MRSRRRRGKGERARPQGELLALSSSPWRPGGSREGGRSEREGSPSDLREAQELLAGNNLRGDSLSYGDRRGVSALPRMSPPDSQEPSTQTPAREVSAALLSHAWRRSKQRRTAQLLDAMGVQCHHGCFSDEFLELLRQRIDEVPSSSASKNMYAVRHFLRDEGLAAQLFAQLPASVTRRHDLHGCCSDLRFIRCMSAGPRTPA